jgi:pyrimidine-nucleoside phosphorylase
MIPAEVIKAKRDGTPLSKAVLRQFITAYVAGSIADYQMAALLMAIYFRGMNDKELSALVEVMIDSGRRMDFSHLSCYVADKHSTGGVGDKVSLILGPLMAAAGLAIPMISGRSLGHTGGTLDKLETIPGFQVDIPLDEFQRIVESVGLAMIGQTDEICPADKKMYALRDVTGTIESLPLICGSIMSKKIAEGIRGLVLDVKVGNGAFMKTLDQAHELGRLLQQVGEAFGVTTDVVYTNMSQPLGRTAGLWCEVRESITALQGEGPEDLMTVTFTLGARLLRQAGKAATHEEAVTLQQELIASGAAYRKFQELVAAQHGNPAALDAYTTIHQPRHALEVTARRTGVITGMDTYQIGLATVELGCGRKKATDRLDPTAGIEILHKTGAAVSAGEPIFRCFGSDRERLAAGADLLQQAVQIGETAEPSTLIYPPG